MKKVPEIRFNGFKGDWTVKLLDDIFRKVTDKNTDNALVETFTNSAQDGIVSQRDFFNHDISNSENIHGYYVVRPDDFVYNPRMSVTAPVGPINRNRLGRAGVMSPLYTVFKAKNSNYNLGFVEYFFKTDKWHSFMWKNGDNGARGDRFSIRDEILKLMPITLPPSNKEQSDISTFFDNLDEYISSQALELQKLKNIKKACLEKMFPKEGELVPEIRFNGFEGNWERTTLNNFLETKVEKNENDKYNKYDIFSVSGEYGVVNQIEFQGKSFAGASLKGYKVTHPGQVIYTKSPLKAQPYGIIKTNNATDGVVSTLYAVYEPKGEVDTSFIQYYFELDGRLNNYLRPLVNKGAKNTLLISDDDALKGYVTFPKDVTEQKEITKYFLCLDNFIYNAVKKLDKLKQIRKGLLEKMFVANN